MFQVSRYNCDHYEKLALEILSYKQQHLDTLKQEEWIFGADESGRGCVIGPLVYTACYWPKKYNEFIQKANFKDQKKLTEAQRVSKFNLIKKLNGEMLIFESISVSADEISKQQLQYISKNLNQISQETALKLIQNTLAQGYNITECYLGPVGPSKYFMEYLKSKSEMHENKIKFIVEEKASSKQQIVGAASICATIIRNQKIDQIQKTIPRKDLGNGHPGDPKTQAYLSNELIPVFAYPQIVRYSQETIKKALLKQHLIIEYFDEENNRPFEQARNFRFQFKKLHSIKYRSQQNFFE